MKQNEMFSALKQYQVGWASAEQTRVDAGPRPERKPELDAAVQLSLSHARDSKLRFMRQHGRAVYQHLTDGLSNELRVTDLSQLAAVELPGLVPTDARLAEEAELRLATKDALELDQGIFFHGIFADVECGQHLMRTMLRPTTRAVAMLDEFKATGVVELPYARVERRDGAAWVFFKNPRYLNAEDDNTVTDVEVCVDLALLDPASEVCVTRGDVIDQGKYKDQNVYCTGINLTRLYHGQISYLMYQVRELGFINKIYRGLHMVGDCDDMGTEKLWLAGVDNFAIGGGCQYLLTMDYSVAAKDAYMTLPARKEGIIPGAANMRLPRFVGDRLARQAIFSELRIECDSDVGRMICDEICEPQAVEEAVTAVADKLANSGQVSAASNRRCFRIAQEPFDLFRSFMAIYSLDQAKCHFSDALIRNLESFWGAAKR
jgi:(3,5-dihydroxyphenyl)acetyl-CoA 1,2-dioxygenase